MVRYFVTAFFTAASFLNAQNAPDVLRTIVGNNQANNTDFAYPISMFGEQHSSFSVNYPLSKTFEAELQGFYNTYIGPFSTDRFRVNSRLNWKMAKKLTVFSGLESEFEIDKMGRKTRKPRIGFVSGVMYDLRENISLESKMNLQLNDSPVGAYGEPLIRMPQVYTVGSKIKF